MGYLFLFRFSKISQKGFLKRKFYSKKLYSMKRVIMTFEESFYWAAAWYNGCGDEFDSVIRYLRIQRINPNNKKTISKPKFIKSDGSTPELELFWMILVEMYGDYGTSPRSGWMYVDELDECLKHLSEIRRKTWASEFEDDV